MATRSWRTRSAPARSGSSTGGARRTSCSSAIRRTARTGSTSAPRPMIRARDRSRSADLRAVRVPLVDRVEVYIIDEAQPRWLAFLNAEHDFLERLPNDYVNVGTPGGQLAPGLKKPRCAMARMRTPTSLTRVQHGDTRHRRLHARQGGPAACHSLGSSTANRYVFRSEVRPSSRRRRSARNVRLRPERTHRNVEYDPARARALLDIYGYVDRDGDGWRESPRQPLALKYALDQPPSVEPSAQRDPEVEVHEQARVAHSNSAYAQVA